MAIIFNRRFKHGTFDFLPGGVLEFEDPDAEPYFTALGVADETDAEPAATIGIDEIDIDPCTIWADGPDKHKFVLPERAAAARGMTVDEAKAFVWSGEVLRNG